MLLLTDIMKEDLIMKHLDALSQEELVARYGDVLPESAEPTKSEIISIVRSEFFKNASADLSLDLAENGLGQIMSRSFGYNYAGEGIDALLRGVRSFKKKREDPEKKD